MILSFFYLLPPIVTFKFQLQIPCLSLYYHSIKSDERNRNIHCLEKKFLIKKSYRFRVIKNISKELNNGKELECIRVLTSWTAHFENEILDFLEFLLKIYHCCA